MNKLAFWRERRAGRCKAPRRRRCGDIVEERQQRRYAPFAAAPPRAAALMPGKLLKFAGYVSIGHEAAAKCQIILARALRNRRWTPMNPTNIRVHRRESAVSNSQLRPLSPGVRSGKAWKSELQHMGVTGV